MKTLIEQLRDGEIAVKNDGTLEELRRVLKMTFNKEQFILGAHTYYYSALDGDMFVYCDYTSFPPHSVKEFIKELDNKQTTMKTITHTQATKIINIACSSWQSRLAEIWGVDIVLKNTINVSDDFYKEMRKACTKEQHELFDEIFGKDEPEYKVGDWVIGKSVGCRTYNNGEHPIRLIEVTDNGFRYDLHSNQEAAGYFIDNLSCLYPFNQIKRKATPEEIRKATYLPDGTPCLVSNNNKKGWLLRYADGNGNFYINGEKSGGVFNCKYHYRLDPSAIAGLPE